MNDEGWVVFDGNNYEKRVYEVRMPDGAIVRAWPNAGTLHIFAGQESEHAGKVVDPDGVVAIRPVPEEHAWDHYKRMPDGTEVRVRTAEEKHRDFGNPSGMRRRRAQQALAAMAGLGGVSLHVPPPPVCHHSFGLAGGFSRCSVCGRRAVRGEVRR